MELNNEWFGYKNVNPIALSDSSFPSFLSLDSQPRLASVLAQHKAKKVDDEDRELAAQFPTDSQTFDARVEELIDNNEAWAKMLRDRQAAAAGTAAENDPTTLLNKFNVHFIKEQESIRRTLQGYLSLTLPSQISFYNLRKLQFRKTFSFLFAIHGGIHIP